VFGEVLTRDDGSEGRVITEGRVVNLDGVGMWFLRLWGRVRDGEVEVELEVTLSVEGKRTCLPAISGRVD
jgi:hypothetical protein